MNENVRLTTEMFENENLTLSKYMQEEFGMEMKDAMKDIKNIDEALKNLKGFIDKIF
jgi:ABC-type phosphate/phosphonate transport system substrate-binding protein